MTDYYDRLIEERRADEQMNMMTYMTQEEYDERRANGTLPENSLVFIHN
jgi:cytochrome P450